MWTPTINIFRDPRWGRGIETYGEDPFLTSILGVAAVRGLQGPDNSKYDKLHACAKHFAVHSGPEWNRHSFNAANIKLRDLHETYLPAFEALVKEADVQEVMCAYNRFEGEPCCGSDQLLLRILREKWGFKGIVVADCGAIADFYKENAHETHKDAASASAEAVLKGTDLDCGSSYKALTTAVKEGLIKESAIDKSVKRLLLARFKLGEMDDNALVPWTKINYAVVASAAHDSIALDMARKSITLLQNKNNILPLQKGNLKIAVMGPNANDSVMQWGNYNGTPAKTITILEGIRSALGTTDKLIYEQGTGLVETTILKSAFSQCMSGKGKGFTASYWNNPERKGIPVVQTQLQHPFVLCTSGATVFAPGVDLTGFTATYHSVFIPEQSGEIVLDFYVNGVLRVLVNEKEVRNMKTGHGSRKLLHTMKVQQGEKYAIQVEFAQANGDAQLNFDIGYKEPVDIQASVAKVADADVVVFVGGISPSLEGEEMGVNLPGFKKGDRTDISLPAIQRQLITALKKAGKQIVFVNCSGSPIGMEEEVNNCAAIVQAWYPGQSGGTAVADVLFGKYNPSGRLPVTFYKDTTQLPDFENYDMAGRTYRYMQQEPLFAFGYGLSYSQFTYGTPVLNKKQIKRNEKAALTVRVTNTSQIDGDEIVQLYIRKKGDAGGPLKTLRAVKRAPVKAGKTEKVTFTLQGRDFEWWQDATQAMDVQPGDFELFIGSSSRDKDLKRVTISLR
jgi:beta-glucosidase